MLKRSLLSLTALFILAFSVMAQESVQINIDALSETKAVSPYIYGKNNSLSDDAGDPLSEAEWQFLKDAGITMFRESGGNNCSKYNWRRQLSSHPDWYNNVYDHNWDHAASSLQEHIPGAQGMWAFQLLGKAASSKDYNFSEWDYNKAQWWEGVHQNLCGNGVVNPDGSGAALVEGDSELYLEDWTADSTTGILEHWFGAGGLGLDKDNILYWGMDNEAEIWNGTHDDVMPELISAEAFMQSYFRVAKKARALYPNIKLMGPVVANEWQWFNWDGGKISYDGSSYVWLEYFIKRVAEEEAASGVKLLDVLDIHFYPGEKDTADVLQLHRVYFDRDYVYPGANGVKRSGESGWDASINKEYIFGRCLDWLAEYMGPDHGVGLAVSETGLKSPSPGVAALWYASMLGEFARNEVEIFTPWTWHTGMYEVLNLFTSNRRDLILSAPSTNEEMISAYPMIDADRKDMSVFLVNRRKSEAQDLEISLTNFQIPDGTYDMTLIHNLPAEESFISASNNHQVIVEAELNEGVLTATLPAMSVAVISLQAQEPDSEFGFMLSMAEAEDGELSGTQVASNISGYSGIGFVSGFTSENDHVSINIEAPESRDYTVVIRYNNESFKAQKVSVNEGWAFSVSLPAVSGWGLAGAGDHYLEAGTNTVTISKDWGYSNIDRIELYAAEERIFDVDPNLIDPEANASTLALYEMLKMQFGHRIISGQTDSNFDGLTAVAGQTPLLIAGDLSSYTEGYAWLWSSEVGGHILGKNPDGTTEDLIAWHQETGGKGLISLQWHWHAPIEETAGQNNFYTNNTDFDIRLAVTPGTPEYEATIRDIDDIAAELQKFEDAGITILWRPLHEAGGGWFWWGAHGAEPCLALWDTLYNRLTDHHKLHNLIWEWSTPEEEWYPGNEKVDILGYDSYPGSYNYGNQRAAFQRLFDNSEGSKLLAMTENGPIPDPDACLEDGAPWLYFMSWADLVEEQNSSEHIREVFNHSDVITQENYNIRSSNEWRSSLYPENWKPGYKDSEGRFLHDFSYAGYHGGGVALPYIQENIIDVTQAPYLADNTGLLDATQAIQLAINDAGNAGGGVVYLPAGTYRIAAATSDDYALTINKNNIVLRGAGPDSTFIFHDQPEMRQKEAIYIAPAYASWFYSGGNKQLIRHDLLMPTRVIPLEDISGFQVGDQVIVRNNPTDAFIEEHGMTGMWDTRIKGVAHLRRIDSIDTANKLLILDTPTRYALKTRDGSHVYLAKTHLQEVGLECFSIGNRESTKSGWGEEDYTISGTGAYAAHSSQLMEFEYTENSWVRRVHTYKPDVNTQDVHLLSNCLLLNMCRHMTVDSCDFQKPQYEGGGGNGYMYTLHANDCLVSNCRANHSRHNYDFKFPFSNGNVIHMCRAENSKYSSDFHMYLSMANLFDRTIVNGDYLESTFRPYGAPIHGHSSSQSVFYNTVGEAYHTNKDYIVDSRQYEWGYVIGTSGEATKVKTTPYSGTQGGYAYDSSPEDYVEGEGEGANLRPLSLYRDQLAKRAVEEVEMYHYDISIRVQNKENGQAIEGSTISIYDQVIITDANGEADFSQVPESFYLEVTDSRYLPIDPMHLVIYSDTLLTIKLDERAFILGFEILDEADMTPFRNARITLDGSVNTTDSDGKASFDVFEGSYDYSVEKYNYATVSSAVEVTADKEVQVLLSRSHADVRIILKEEGTPVNDAWIRLNEDSILSSSIGLGIFASLPVKESYPYTVRKEGYQLLEGDFYLEDNFNLQLEMQKLTGVSFREMANAAIRLWPNPTRDKLTLECDAPEQFRKLQVLDINGRVVYETEITGPATEISTDHLPAAVYMIRIQASRGSRVITRTFIKQE